MGATYAMKKILIVDDEKIFLIMTERILSASYFTICASSGYEAIELYKSEKPDMVLSDLLMPGMSGYELKQKLQDEYGEIPFMFMTADTAEETERKGFDIGAMDFVQKPFRADILLRRVGNILQTVEKIQGLKRDALTDKMTGLKNKVTAESEIAELCKKVQGALLMIDLDNFKLINDIYGHAMGDKILVCFAQILKSVVRPIDVIGRLGGDEFIAFCQNVTDEAAIEKKSRYINKYLLDAAKELMGEDMNIPLGASIGCTLVPDEGIDFTDLREKADKALYAVKQNGKHGFVFYTDLAQKEKEEESVSSDLNSAKKIFSERSIKKGAFLLPLEQFRTVYQFLSRISSIYPNEIFLILFSLKVKDGATTSIEETIDGFVEFASNSLRQSDVITKSGKNQCIVILSKSKYSSAYSVTERILHSWSEEKDSEKVEVLFEIGKME